MYHIVSLFSEDFSCHGWNQPCGQLNFRYTIFLIISVARATFFFSFCFLPASLNGQIFQNMKKWVKERKILQENVSFMRIHELWFQWYTEILQPPMIVSLTEHTKDMRMSHILGSVFLHSTHSKCNI